MNHSKPCPHCGRTISSNKEMCFAGALAAAKARRSERAKKAAATRARKTLEVVAV